MSINPSPIEAHSKKPGEACEKIVALLGDVPRVELFAWQTSPGWDVWGNEVECTPASGHRVQK
jgi:N6-adenosine-specific RNA methylase IME4